jgi:diguanylate cyclase (GGDEF)-like protein
MIDVDSLKTINDCFGHLAGDRALCSVAARILRALRVEDVLARYGGDEFVAILPNAELEAAAAAAQRALESLLAVPSFDANPGVAASVGVAQWRDPMTVDALLEACDTALLRSKRQGKGRVTRASASNPL